MPIRPATSCVVAGMKLTRPCIVAAALAAALAGAAFAGVVVHKSATVQTIKVTEKEFHISIPAKHAAGPVKFVIKNTGKYPHALALSGPGVKLKKTALIKPGKSATLAVTLKSGRYSIWCPVPGHAAQGMKVSVTVPGGTAVSATTTSATTTDSGGGGTAWG